MDIRIKPDFFFADNRGKLVQLVHEGYEQMNVLVSRQGVQRGGHYHRQSRECFFVISGSVEVAMEDIDGNSRETYVFHEDDFFQISPGKAHSMFFPQDCVMVGMYDRCIEERNGEKDIYPHSVKVR